MRKYIMIVVLAVLIIMCLLLMIIGLGIGKFNIVYSYSDIKTASQNKANLMYQLNKQNTQEFVEKKNLLEQAADKYEKTKSEYDRLMQEGKIVDISSSAYEYEALKSKITNYAIEKNVALNLECVTSKESIALSSDYTMCDLEIYVTGGYIDTTDFIYCLEDDDLLKFEISELEMKNSDILKTTFVVKNIPIKNVNI